MKYSTQLNSKLRSAAVALGVLCISCLTPTRGQESKSMDKPAKLQHLASADAVPEGLTASDWTSIRAAYQAHQHPAVRVEAVIERAIRNNSGAPSSTGAALSPGRRRAIGSGAWS